MKVMEAIFARRSIRKYDNRPIKPKSLEAVKDALRFAPSACNNQPWRFVLVTGEKLRKDLAVAAFNQHFIAQAPMIVVGCAVPEEAYKNMGGSGGNSAEIDVTIALDHLTLAAAEQGLGTCWIGAFREEEVKSLLRVPAEAKVIAMTPLGYPQDPGALKAGGERKERKKVEQVFYSEQYGNA